MTGGGTAAVFSPPKMLVRFCHRWQKVVSRLHPTRFSSNPNVKREKKLLRLGKAGGRKATIRSPLTASERPQNLKQGCPRRAFPCRPCAVRKQECPSAYGASRRRRERIHRSGRYILSARTPNPARLPLIRQAMKPGRILLLPKKPSPERQQLKTGR